MTVVLTVPFSLSHLQGKYTARDIRTEMANVDKFTTDYRTNRAPRISWSIPSAVGSDGRVYQDFTMDVTAMYVANGRQYIAGNGFEFDVTGYLDNLQEALRHIR